MKQNQTPQFMQLPTFDGTVPAELSSDYILPDTYPDVKKILRARARPVLIGRYISGRKLEFSGAVDYVVIFSADGESGETLHCVHFAGDFESALGELDSLDDADIALTPRMTALNVRLSNPRKLSIRSTVSTDVKISSMFPCEIKCEGARTPMEELKLERLCETVTTGRERTFTAEPLRISENLEPDSTMPSIDEIVTCDASIHFHEARPMYTSDDFTVSLKGDAIVNCLYKSQSEAGNYRSFSRKIPISYIVGADDFKEYFASCRPETIAAYAIAVPTEINAAVAEDNYGERRIVELDMTADVNLHITGGEEVSATLDAYSAWRESECVMKDFDCQSPSKVVFANFSIGETLSRDGLTLPDESVIVDAAADVSVSSVTLERGRAVMSGNAFVSCIMRDGDGSFTSSDFTVPVRCEMSGADIKEPFAYNCLPSVSDLRVRIDPERVSFDFEVSLCTELFERSRRHVVETVRLIGEPRQTSGDSAITLCYPSKDETMWQIAKRYNTTVSALEAANRENSRVFLVPSAMPHTFVIDA